jgi:hypothetical protein
MLKGFVLTARIGPATLVGLPGLELGCHRFTEILGSEDGADFDIRIRQHGVRAALDPLDRLLDRPDLPDPKAGDQFLRLGFKPSPAKRIPALTSDALNSPIAVRSSCVGITPASLSWVALTRTMTFIW